MTPVESERAPQSISEAVSRLEQLSLRAKNNELVQAIQLPLWYEQERGAPNSFLRSSLFAAIQGKDRVYCKAVEITASKDYSIKYTGEQLNQEDLSVWQTLVHITRETPLGDVCHFTAHGILKKMGSHTGGDEHHRLHETITRLMGAVVEIRFESDLVRRFIWGNL
jgi:hypothetical protein